MLCAALTCPAKRYGSSADTSPASSTKYARSTVGACLEAYAPFCPPVTQYRIAYTVRKRNPTSAVTAMARLTCAFKAI